MNQKSDDKAKNAEQKISTKPDELVKRSNKGKVELTDDELVEVSGGLSSSDGTVGGGCIIS